MNIHDPDLAIHIQRLRAAWPLRPRRERRRDVRTWWRNGGLRGLDTAAPRLADSWPEHWRLINEAQGFPVGAWQ